MRPTKPQYKQKCDMFPNSNHVYVYVVRSAAEWLLPDSAKPQQRAANSPEQQSASSKSCRTWGTSVHEFGERVAASSWCGQLLIWPASAHSCVSMLVLLYVATVHLAPFLSCAAVLCVPYSHCASSFQGCPANCQQMPLLCSSCM